MAKFGDVVLAMAERDGIEIAFRRLAAHQRVEPLLAKHLVDRPQAIGPLGMTGRREVVEAGRMGEEKGGHERSWRGARERDGVNLGGCEGMRKGRRGSYQF